MGIEEIIKKYSLNEEEETAFRNYLKSEFFEEKICKDIDESFLEKWTQIYEYSKDHNALDAVNLFVTPKRPVNASDSSKIKIDLYQSFAGKIPIIYVEDAALFEELVTNAIYKGIRPDNLSETGAAFAFGKSTRFIILSNKPYSNIPASELGLLESDWLEKSMIIRREHECTHNFTKTVFGISRNHLHDELLADFFGLYEAFGEYKAEYFQRFLGIIGTYGGRLKVYTKDLPEKVFSAISEVAVICSNYLEEYSKQEDFLSLTREERLMKLCLTDLETMIGRYSGQ